MAYEKGTKRTSQKGRNATKPSRSRAPRTSKKDTPKTTEPVETVESIENAPEPTKSEEPKEPEVESTEKKDTNADSKDPNDYLRIRKGDKLASTAKRQRLLQNPQDTWVCFCNMIQTNERYRMTKKYIITFPVSFNV